MKTLVTLLSCLMTLFLLSTLSSCYRMPGENEFSVVPTTNNPSVTYEKTDCFFPGIGQQ